MLLRKRVIIRVLATVIVASAAQAADKTPVGHWEGAIELPDTNLAIRVDFDQPSADGNWTGTIDIPAQMLRGFALADVAVNDASVTFVLPNIPGDPVFAGSLNADTTTLAGTFTQGGQEFPFSLQRTELTATADTPARGVPGEGLAGIWQGSLRTGAAELRLVLHVNEAPDGTLSATLDSIDQSATGIPVSSVSIADNNVRLEVAAVRGGFEGTMNVERSEIAGTWRQRGGELSLVFKRRAEAPDTSRPQEPKKPYPYEEQEVRFDNEHAGITLVGTLTIPRGDGPFPAVVLVSGSGPQNRDEAVMGHRPFLVLADHLTRQGIAVLRYDDRGVGESTGRFGAATHDDFADDARAAFEFLRQQERIDASCVGLCGHSEGGIHAPIVAAKTGDVAFIVTLAGVGVPMDQLLRQQRDDIVRLSGFAHVEKPEERAISDEIFTILRNEGATPEARQRVRELFEQSLTFYTEEQRTAYGLTDALMDQQLGMMFSPWFIKLLAYDPAPTLAKVQCPVLAINGDKDVQVAADDNLEGIRAGLVAGGNEAVTIRKLPDLNHLFQHCSTGAISEYGSIEETFNPAALEVVSDWILATVARGATASE